MRQHEESNRVDMLAVARVAQGVDGAGVQPTGSLKVIAPAKVNLFLDVGARRADGYHEVVSIMHALTLHDVLYLRTRPGANEPGAGLDVELTCCACEGLPELDVDAEHNIVVRAARALARRIGRAGDETLSIRLEKHIPAQAGLGGGSADAAAALVGCAQLWGLSADDERVEQTARELGADVPFFLHGGCACLTGAGDEFSHTLSPMKGFVVLVKPEGGVSTPQAYRAFDEAPVRIDAADAARARAARDAAEVPLRNNLAPASESLMEQLASMRAWLAERFGSDAVLLAGSGAATFALCDSFAQAGRIASEAQALGWWSRATTFGPVRAAVVPD